MTIAKHGTRSRRRAARFRSTQQPPTATEWKSLGRRCRGAEGVRSSASGRYGRSRAAENRLERGRYLRRSNTCSPWRTALRELRRHQKPLAAINEPRRGSGQLSVRYLV